MTASNLAAAELLHVEHIVRLARLDTLYRDIYLERGRDMLAPFLSLQAYQGGKLLEDELQRLSRQNVAAVDNGNWEEVRTLTARIRTLKGTVEESAATAALGREVYEPPDVVVDPFSPGLIASAEAAESSRRELLELLETLQAEDLSLAALYRTRHAFFTSRGSLLESGDDNAAEPAQVDPSQLRQEAARAARDGDVDRLDLILREMAALQNQREPGPAGLQESVSPHADLGRPFPDEAMKRGEALGFAPVRAQPYPEISSYLHRWSWQPSLPAPFLTQDGRIRIAGVPDDRMPPEVSDHLRDTLDLFLIHPYVNSAGIRYLPLLAAETVLVETFPEAPDGPDEGKLLGLLGLARRRGLSRREIERALLQSGNRVLRENFGLDPLEYRLVCVPPDIYCRTGITFGWGKEPVWTHFDGYQLVHGGGTRALVGGDTRYGGMFDLCSISDMDQREGVIARFAVVRRERLAQF